MNDLWLISLSKVERWNANPRSVPTRDEADKVMKAIGGKVDNDDLHGCYNVVLPGDLDIIMRNHEGSFTIDLTVDGEDYELTAQA